MFCFFFFFKQKTAYEMRISDWSSDVCSSDLPEREPQYVLDQMRATLGTAAFNAQYLQRPVAADGQLIKREWFRSYTSPPAFYPGEIKIGRASCRERVCQYV